mmetsp:Transcript_19843/g.42264  ORF Transcript_19843/g.42264 Transcript_19843/m.42264 type:complete len:300 (-) Transcript_19843:169-1068(-)
MLSRNLLGDFQHLIVVVDYNYFPVILPGGTRSVRGGDFPQLFLHLGQRLLGKLLRRGHKDRWAVVTVLRLAQQVGRGDLGIDGVVAKEQSLCGPSQKIDANPPEDLLLGLRHEGIARAGDEIHGFDGLGAIGHGADGLGAAHEKDVIGPCKVHRCDGRVRQAAWLTAGHGSCTGDDAVAASHLGGEDGHVGGSDHGELATRDIATHILDGDVLVAEHDPWLRLHLHVLHGVPLQLGKAPDVGLGVLDVQDLLPCAFPHAFLDVRLPQLLVGHTVELRAVLIQGTVTSLPNVLENPTHNL